MDRPYALLKAFVGIVIVIAVGTLGYHFIEGWTLLEGLYMTVITITTIGFKEVRELSDSRQDFHAGHYILGDRNGHLRICDRFEDDNRGRDPEHSDEAAIHEDN